MSVKPDKAAAKKRAFWMGFGSVFNLLGVHQFDVFPFRMKKPKKAEKWKHTVSDIKKLRQDIRKISRDGRAASAKVRAKETGLK